MASIVCPQPYRQIPECGDSRLFLYSKETKKLSTVVLALSASVDSGIESILLSLRAKTVTARLVDFDGFEAFERAAKRRKNMRHLGLRLARPPQHTTAIQIKVVQAM